MAGVWEYIEGELAGLAAEPAPTKAPEEPDWLTVPIHERQLTIVDGPLPPMAEPMDLGAARQAVREALGAYFCQDAPGHQLLVRASPGVGKTTAAVGVAEVLAHAGQRVLYAGPRHAFFGDILGITEEPHLWYEWLPRQVGDEAAGKVETCPYALEIAEWMERGYGALDFCQGVCGWEAVRKHCVYHAQKRRKEPIIFGQHAHVTLGHPLEFHAVIGDEDPLGAFLYPRRVPRRGITPQGVHGELLQMLGLLARTAQGTDFPPFEGQVLLDLLGGAEKVLRVCEEWTMPLTAQVYAPHIEDPAQVEHVDYCYLHQLVPLLKREARVSIEGREWPHRVVLEPGGLRLYQRRGVNDDLPPRMAWLDGTGHPHLYTALFRRPVVPVEAKPRLQARIFQVWNRANGKGSLLESKDKGLTLKAKHLEQQVGRILQEGGYAKPGIVTFKDVIAQTPLYQGLEHAHFGAARGTNAMQDCDGLIVAGAPLPAKADLEKIARMVFFDRDTPFEKCWAPTQRAYPGYLDPSDGKRRGIQVGGYWMDPDLLAVMQAAREHEIEQAAHRCRPVNRACDIWLLMNIPVEGLVPNYLWSIADLFGVPEPDMDAFLWRATLDLAEQLADECEAQGVRPVVTTTALMERLGVARKTAVKYIEALKGCDGWEPAVVRTKGGRRGRAPQGVMRRT